MHAAKRQHLRAVFARRDMADRLALRSHDRRLGSDVTVGVDLHLDAAIREDALGDDGDQIDAFDLLADDEGRRLVVGIGGAGAYGGDEATAGVDQLAIPRLALGTNGTRLGGVVEDRQRVEPHDPPADIAVAVAGAAAAVCDVAHHRARIAADLFSDQLLAGVMGVEAFGKLAHRVPRSHGSRRGCALGVAGTLVTSTRRWRGGWH
jgi:hypothetical protein